MSGSRRSSPVWNYFAQTQSNPRKLRCKICKDILPYTKTGTTTRLLRHARKHSLHFPVKNMLEIKTESLEEDGLSENATKSLKAKKNFNASAIQKPSKRKSKVWQCFNTLLNGSTDSQLDEGHARCKFCPRVLSFNNGSTGNLNRHIKTLHKPVWAMLCRKTIPKFGNTHMILSKKYEETASSDDGLIQQIKCEKELDDTEMNDCHNQFGDQEQSQSLAKQFETEDTNLNNDSTINSSECAEMSLANDTEETPVIEEIYNDDYIPQDDHCDIQAEMPNNTSQIKPQRNKARQHLIKYRKFATSAEIMHVGTQNWFKSRANFIDTKTHCFLQEHRQKMKLQEIEHGEKMKLQEIEHGEKMKLLQLQQELLRKQIEVEHGKITQKHDS